MKGVLLSRYTLLSLIVLLTFITITTVTGQTEVTNSSSGEDLNIRQLELEIEDDESTTTSAPVTVATISPERYYQNFNAALNVTSGIFQDILCRLPLLRLCEGVDGLKLPQYPVAPDTTTIPTTTPATTKEPAKVAFPNLLQGGHNVIIIAQQKK